MEEKIELESMPMSQKLRVADDLGAEVANIMNEAMKKANSLLEQYGYCVNVNVDFCKLSEKTLSDEA